ncbi:hypothetical protein TWF718_000443 [Orbilia javanica]|uniref:GPI inositol-deacylase winged helix domain-containing protein n=1 Tax=Orbilia javanica TaxID=47235 RepID=A0AAN8RFW5_9PEZI
MILSKSSNVEEAKKLLQIVIAAARPLTLEEMSLALALKDEHQSYRDLDLKPERFREYVRDLCGLFVIINSKIYLLHQTVKEFLVQNDLENPTKCDLKWKHSIQLPDSHKALAEICIQHLLFAEFEADPLTENATLSQYIGTHVFLDYSANHWTTHVHKSQIKPEGIRDFLRLCESSKRCRTWFRVYWMSTNTEFPENFTALMIASYFGLTAGVIRLLEKDFNHEIDLDSKDNTYGRSALSWAAGNGFDCVVELLVGGIGGRWKDISLPFRRGAQVDSADRYHRTPLVYAVWNGHAAVVDILLRAGARIDSRDDIGGTPLVYAICSGHHDIEELVSRKGTKINLGDDKITELLFSAARKGYAPIVKLLFETSKVDPDLKDRDGWTLLSHGVEGNSVSTVQFLLDNGAKTDYTYTITPLSRAAEKDNHAIVKLLLENGAQPDLEDGDGQKPLSRTRNSEIVQLLESYCTRKRDSRPRSPKRPRFVPVEPRFDGGPTMTNTLTLQD